MPNERVEKMHTAIVANNYSGDLNIVYLYYINDKGEVSLSSSHGCHAGMGHETTLRSSTIGCYIPKFGGKTEQDFLNWLVSEDSVYYPLIKHIGENFHVVRDTDNKVKGFIVDTKDVNFKLLVNFFKSTRTVNEHAYHCMPFWKKWRMEQGKDPKICFVSSYFIDSKGNKISNGHSCLESNWINNGQFNLKTVAYPKENTWWRVGENPRKSGLSYYGENAETWGGGTFSFHKDIPIIKLGAALKTRFVHIYDKLKEEKSNSYSDETVGNFLLNYKTLIK